VVHVHGLRNLADHVVAFAKNVKPKEADKWRTFVRAYFKSGLDGRKLRGVPEDGAIFLAFTETPKLEDADSFRKAALVAAVTDYAAFRDNLLTEDERKTLKTEAEDLESAQSDLLGFDANLFFVDKKDHVVVALDRKIAESFAKVPTGLDGKIGKEQGERLLRSDAALYLRVDAFGKDYADQIGETRKSLERAIALTAEESGQAAKPLAALAGDAVAPLFQAVEDSQGLLYTLDVRPGGLLFHAETEARAGTNTAAAFKDFRPSAFKDLDKLPSGKSCYVGVQTVPALYKTTGTMLFSSLADPKSKESRAVEAALAEMLPCGPRARVMALTVPPAGVEVWQFDDPKRAAANQARLIEATGAALVQSGVLTDKPEIQVKARKYKDFDLAAVHLTWDLKKLAAPGGDAPKEAVEKTAASLKDLLGEDLRVWFGTDGRTFLQITAPDWQAAEKQLDRYFSGESVIGDDKAFAEVRQALPAEATALMVLDLGQLAAVAADKGKPLLAKFAKYHMMDLDKLAKLGATRPGYVGMAATLQAERSSIDVFVSAEALKQLDAGGFRPFARY
jgi:hypothetical protein